MCSLYSQNSWAFATPKVPYIKSWSEWSSKSIIIGIYIEIQILTIDYNTCHANVLMRIQLSEFSNKFLRFQNVYNESSRELKSFFLEKNFFAHYTYSILILNFPPWNVAGKFERNIKHSNFQFIIIAWSAPILALYKMRDYLTFWLPDET